jgi:peptidoglycan/LPS O-acetylase OafA/YrhL
MRNTTDSPTGTMDPLPHPPADTPGGTELGFRPDVEGLRAVAVVLVVLFHAGLSWFPGGYVGVDVFFVISGFLITGLLLREHEQKGTVSIKGFYARRARRILPAAMLVIILTVLASYFIQNFIQYAKVAQDGRWTALFAGNIHFAHVGAGYFQKSQAPSPL